MRTRRFSGGLFFGLLMILFFVAANAPVARAQGVIVPGPCRRCPPPIVPPRPGIPLPRALPVKSIKIDTKISAQVATTHVEQIFRNDTDQTLEGTYFFPIPEAASISEFAIWDGNNRLVGEVRGREEARRIYDEIVRRQRDPGLLEYAGKDLFQASIFPIPPRSDKKLEITYTQTLRAESKTVSYRYPLGTGRNVSEVGTVSGNVYISGVNSARNIYSPSHEISVSPTRDYKSAGISFESKGAREPQDFQLFYTLTEEDFGLTLLTHREPGKDGHFLLMLSPKDGLAESEYASKDIVFVLDTSGSMAEAGKMEKARAALLFGVNTLRPGDRFNVISFAGEERLMSSGLIQADEAGRARGVRFAQSLRPVGGTNINGSLTAALRQFEANDRPRLLVFMTDGLPTVGETNIARIVENARAARVEGTRLFTFGVGYDVNTALLDKLAAENGGVAEYVEPKEDIEVKVSSFFAKVSYPVLTDLQLDFGNVETDLLYPRATPDLFRGGQVTLIGRYRNANDLRSVRLRLTGRTGRESKTFAYENLRFPLEENDNDFLPRLWATRRVGWLMEQVRTNGENKELRDEIVDLGTRHGIVTPYTSYLALEPGAVVTDGADNAVTVTRDERRVSNLPRDRRGGAPANRPMSSADSGASGGAPPPPAAAKATTGAVAVRESRRAREQQEAVRSEREDDDESGGAVRRVNGKTFYLRDGGVWTDAEFKADARLPETVLVFGGDEYFALLKRERKLAAFFALGERIVVVFNGRVYRVNAASN